MDDCRPPLVRDAHTSKVGVPKRDMSPRVRPLRYEWHPWRFRPSYAHLSLFRREPFRPTPPTSRLHGQAAAGNFRVADNPATICSRRARKSSEGARHSIWRRASLFPYLTAKQSSLRMAGDGGVYSLASSGSAVPSGQCALNHCASRMNESRIEYRRAKEAKNAFRLA